MKTRILGSSTLEISRIGLGTWAIGGNQWRYGWGPQDDDESIKTIYKALDKGINWIDTAAIYGLGHSEEIIGKAIAGMSERPIIATKCGRKPKPNGELYGDLSINSIKKEAEDSLKRLKIDVIDLYQIHWPLPDKDLETGWQAIFELIHEGKIRYGGVSNFSVDQMKRITAIHPVVSLQPPYNMIQRDIEKEHLQYCASENIGIIGYSPMYRGLLTGKFSKEKIDQLPDDDHRKENPHFREPELSINLHFVKKLGTITKSIGLTISQLAIAWSLRFTEVTGVIVGARHPSQITETAAAGDVDLPESIKNEIELILMEREKQIDS